MDDRFDMIIKIVLIGETAVGKTNLLLRYTDNKYDFSQRPTIGMDFVSKDVTLEGKKIKIQFWDTAGQEKYKSIANSYFKISNGIVLVYDVTRRETFEKLGRWLDDIHSNSQSEIRILLVGNKVDLTDQRQVPTEEGKEFARANGLFFWETSGKTNQDNCVFRAFDLILEECLREASRREQREDGEQFDRLKRESLKVKQRDKKNDRGCC
jgi:Ras-related protein Rab-11A